MIHVALLQTSFHSVMSSVSPRMSRSKCTLFRGSSNPTPAILPPIPEPTDTTQESTDPTPGPEPTPQSQLKRTRESVLAEGKLVECLAAPACRVLLSSARLMGHLSRCPHWMEIDEKTRRLEVRLEESRERRIIEIASGSRRTFRERLRWK